MTEPERECSGSTVRCQYLLTYNPAGERCIEAEQGRRGGLPARVFAKLTPTLCHSPLPPDMRPESVSLEMIKRTATAIDDLAQSTPSERTMRG